jgi:hypothetical protein
VPTYEKVVDGQVVERVIPVDGDYTDTLLGCLALEYKGGDGWRREGQTVKPAEKSTEPEQPAKSARSKRDGS